MSLAEKLKDLGILKLVDEEYDKGKECDIEINVDGYGNVKISANGSKAALAAAAVAYIDALIQKGTIDEEKLQFMFDYIMKNCFEGKEE